MPQKTISTEAKWQTQLVNPFLPSYQQEAVSQKTFTRNHTFCLKPGISYSTSFKLFKFHAMIDTIYTSCYYRMYFKLNTVYLDELHTNFTTHFVFFLFLQFEMIHQINHVVTSGLMIYLSPKNHKETQL